MNADQAKDIMREMAATWRVEFTDDHIETWRDTLKGRVPAHARAAIRMLKVSEHILPSHADFVAAYGAVTAKAQAAESRQLPPARQGVTAEGRALIAEARAKLRRVNEAKP